MPTGARYLYWSLRILHFYSCCRAFADCRTTARPDAAEQTIRQIRQTQALGIAITPLLSHWSCIVSEFLFYGPNTAEMRLQLLSIKLT
jgi:hypothetical protein